MGGFSLPESLGELVGGIFPFFSCVSPPPCGQLYMTDPRCAELSSLETNLYTECRQHAIEFTVRQEHVNTHPLNLCVCVALSAGPPGLARTFRLSHAPPHAHMHTCTVLVRIDCVRVRGRGG